MNSRATLFACVLGACSGDPVVPTTENDPTTIVSLTFDDTRADQYQVGAMVAARQMRATFYVNSPRIGRDGYMTLDELTTLQSDGNEIAGHTLGHLHLPELDADAALREICDDRVALVNMGFEASTFAYPFGNETPGILRMAELCGYNAARDSTGLALGGNCTNCPHSNSLDALDVYNIKSVGPVQTTTTLEELQQAVIDAESAGGGWVPFVFHHVCDGCSSNSLSPATLSAFLDWLAERKATGTAVKTVSEVIGGASRATVEGPRPGPAANLIQNPSLERDEDHNDVPDCWHQRGSGNNDATYALTDVAFDGDVAQQITITRYADGARRLLTRPECPLLARPGHAYRITSWYMADTPPRYAVYYRNTSGAWVSLEQSPAMPTSSTFAQAVHTTRVLPDDATAISVGLSINAVGSLTMDAFTAIDASESVGASPPSVAVTAPAEAATVSGVVGVTANAADGDGVARVDFRVDDMLQDWDDSAPFELSWDTSRVAPGPHVITARAFDVAGNATTSAPINVVVGRR